MNSAPAPRVNSAPAPRGATTHELAPILGPLVYVLNAPAAFLIFYLEYAGINGNKKKTGRIFAYPLAMFYRWMVGLYVHECSKHQLLDLDK